MRDRDTIHILAEARFNGECSEMRAAEFTTKIMKVLSVIDKNTSLLLTVRSVSDSSIHKYRVSPTSNLGQLIADYERQHGGHWKILFEGRLIGNDDTAASVILYGASCELDRVLT